MGISPDTSNYTLGKGILYFDKKNQATGLYEGERDLGNAPAVNMNISLEELAHFSARGGLKAKDKKIISQISPTVTFTLDEQSADNVAMLFMASQEEITQAAASGLTKAIVPKPGRYFDLEKRKIGIQTLAYNTMTAAFTVDAELSAVGGFTANILQVIPGTGATGVLILSNVVGTVAAAATIVDDNASPGSAKATAPVSFVTTNVSIPKAGGGFYAAGTDFRVDPEVGRVYITPASTIPETTPITITYACQAATYTKMSGLAETLVEGRLRFVSDNPAGTQKELKIHSTSIVPSGDTALIGDDWSTMSFSGEILKDEVGHPDSPYCDIIIPD